MGLIAKCIMGFVLVCLFAAFLYDPIYFIEALGPLWEGMTMIGRGIIYLFVNLPEWVGAIAEFWKHG